MGKRSVAAAAMSLGLLFPAALQAQAQARFITVDQGPDELAADLVLAGQLGSSLVTPPEKEGYKVVIDDLVADNRAGGDGRARHAVRLRGRRDARGADGPDRHVPQPGERHHDLRSLPGRATLGRPLPGQGRASARAGEGIPAATKRAGLAREVRLSRQVQHLELLPSVALLPPPESLRRQARRHGKGRLRDQGRASRGELLVGPRHGRRREQGRRGVGVGRHAIEVRGGWRLAARRRPRARSGSYDFRPTCPTTCSWRRARRTPSRRRSGASWRRRTARPPIRRARTCRAGCCGPTTRRRTPARRSPSCGARRRR